MAMNSDSVALFDLPTGVVNAVVAALTPDPDATGAFRCTCSAARSIVAEEASHLNLQHADAGELAAILQEFSGGSVRWLGSE